MTGKTSCTSFTAMRARMCARMAELCLALCTLKQQVLSIFRLLVPRFVMFHPLVASAVIGATDAHQLVDLLDIAEQPALSEDVLTAIDAIHRQYPNPCP